MATDETAGATNEVAVMTADSEMTTVDTETTVVENDTNAARTTITTGPVQSARTPISPSERCAIDAKPHDRVAAEEAVDEIATTVADETTEAAETTTADSETTVVDGIIGEATGNRVEHSPITIGPAPSVKTPISRSEMSATGARNLAQVVAVEVADDETIDEAAPTAINEEITTVAEAAMTTGEGDAPGKAEGVLVHNIAGHRTFNPAEPEENARAMRTTNHREISGRLLGNLSAKMTERT